MKTRIDVLAVASLLMGTSAFAGEQHRGDVTIQVAEKTIVTISMDEQPEGTKLTFNSGPKASTLYDDEKGTVTIKGTFSVEVTQEKKALLHIDVADGVAVYGPLPAVAAAPAILPVPLRVPAGRPGTFCGQGEINRLFLEMQMKKQREEAESTRLAAAQVVVQPAKEAEPQE